jgi:protein SCO1/2
MASAPDHPPATGRSTRPRRALAAAAAGLVLVLALGLAACGSDGGSDGSSPAATDTLEGLTRTDPIVVADASLPEVAADGTTTPFRFQAPSGGLLFVAFGYTNCPDVCPTTLYDMKKALASMAPAQAERVQVAFATVDPERDTAETMIGYLGSFVTGGHPLRTTDQAELRAAQKAFGVTSQVVKQADGTVEVSHSARSFVVDDRGRIAVEWAFGTSYESMAHDLQILLARQTK